MRYASTRVAVASSLAFLCLWTVSSLVEALAAAAGAWDVVTVVASAPWTYDLPLRGFIGIMILGMAQHFVPLFSGREIWSPRAALATVGLADVAVVSRLLLPAPARFAGDALWLAVAALFVVTIVLTLRSPEIAVRPMERRAELRSVDRLAIPMTGAAMLYLLAASAGSFLVALPGDPFSLSAYSFSFVHLYTLGFITLMVFGVGLHLFPRFLDAAPPLPAVRAIQVLALASPAAVAFTMPSRLDAGDPVRILFVLSASSEAMAAFLFAGLVLFLWRKSAKRRPAATFHVLAVVWLSAGVVLGVLFGLSPLDYLGWAAAHGWVNLFGFAGFSIFGVLHEILPPFAPRGPAAVRRVTRLNVVLGTSGLLLVLLAFDRAIQGQALAAYAAFASGFAAMASLAVLLSVGSLGTLAAIRRRPG